MKDKTMLRNRVIYTRVTEKEFHEIIRKAAKMDVSFSEFVRQGALILAREDKFLKS